MTFLFLFLLLVLALVGFFALTLVELLRDVREGLEELERLNDADRQS